MMPPYIVANWKMNGTLQHAADFAEQFKEKTYAATVVVCPSATSLGLLANLAVDTPLLMGVQNISEHQDGAYTGDISASQMKDAGADYVLVGHSERRQHHRETAEQLKEKLLRARENDLTPILCVGESLEERESGKAFDAVSNQLVGSLPQDMNSIIIAYEPVWAIGTGKVPTLDDIHDMHAHIKVTVGKHINSAQSVHVLYGGSVKPDNATEILATTDVDGVLVGGASLDPHSFESIILTAKA